jgi:hypothetical protein
MKLIFLPLLYILSLSTFADQWSYPAKLDSQIVTLNDLTIERVIDTRQNQHYPLYQVKISRDGEELANYRNLTFEQIDLFDNGNFIFAGTNTGLSQFAYFILDKDGGLVKTKAHSDDIPYCKQTITLVREWIDDQFEIKETYEEIAYRPEDEKVKYFTGAKVKVCSGEYFDIFK